MSLIKVKIFILISFFFLNSNALSKKVLPAEILTADESFVVSLLKEKNTLKVSIKINERSYIYSEHLSLTDGNRTIFYDIIGNSEIIKDEFYGESLIFKNLVIIVLENIDKLKGKTLLLSYQGCLENLICYPKISREIIVGEENKPNFFLKKL
jgi:thiol:disulfide interchange protein DsbD